jgi:hypothetical protein
LFFKIKKIGEPEEKGGAKNEIKRLRAPLKILGQVKRTIRCPDGEEENESNGHETIGGENDDEGEEVFGFHGGFF